jgi:hypothetical protein
MTAALVVILEVLACLGLGVVMLRTLGVLREFDRGEAAAWAFALGLGGLGWLLFFLGAVGGFSDPWLAGLLVLCSLGLWSFRGIPAGEGDARRFGIWGWLLIAVLLVALGFDFLEGLSPPADADTMAYHFDLPKRFLMEGRLFFVPRAMDGAIPMLVHMTYVPALGLGGEKALTLWAMVSGWGASALLYVLARRWLDQRWSLTVALVYLTLPAVIYGGGTGQVEVRNALFAMVGAVAVAEARRTGELRYAMLAGIGAGLFMAGKLTGLQFVLACGLVLIVQRRWFVQGAVFGLAALAAGGQWYGWNWWHSGDPLFPVLYGLVDYKIPGSWDAEHQAELWRFIREEERAVPNNFAWMIAYPFVATLAGKPVFESGRTGLGPFVLIVLPFVLAGIWRFRARLRNSPLTTVAAVMVVFYVVWFLAGSSQRIRHLVPVFPLVLLCGTVAAERWATARDSLHPLAAAMALVLGMQAGGHLVFSVKFARHVFSGESRDAFLTHNLNGFESVRWINAHLTRNDRLFLYLRWLNFHIDVPIHYGHTTQDATIDISDRAADPHRFLDQLRAQGITHLLMPDSDSSGPARGLHLWKEALTSGCLTEVATTTATAVGSRTLGSDSPPSTSTHHILKIAGRDCSP